MAMIWLAPFVAIISGFCLASTRELRLGKELDKADPMTMQAARILVLGAIGVQLTVVFFPFSGSLVLSGLITAIAISLATTA